MLGGVDALNAVGGAGLIVMETGWLTVEPSALLACRVKTNVPVAEGVPKSTPVVGFSVKPVGSKPLATL